MKLKSFFFTVFLIVAGSMFTQQIPFSYSVKLKPRSIPNLPGLHSFVFAQHNGKWLIIGGRKDGLHARQPFNAFPAATNNTELYVVDINTQQFWTASVNSLPTGLKEQLQSTNMNFYQDSDTLYILGGYGYSATAADHITYPNLSSVLVSGLINAIINSASITPFFKQITHAHFAVNGGQLGKIGPTFYLVGGHRFDGRYNPMGNPTYTQTYVNGIKTFHLNNFGAQLSFSNYTLTSDQVHLHRRDYNLVPQIFPNGNEGYTISSGVFQTNVNLPFLYPVDVTSSGYIPVTTFNQYLSNYHSAKAALYDSVQNTMHSLFFGGMSQYTYVNNVLTQDNNVPFVKTISRVSRDSNGNLMEYKLHTDMPALIGASSEFIPNETLPHYKSEIIKLSQLNGDSNLIGHIYGGIYSPDSNPFTNNNTAVTNAHAVIYEVWILKDVVTKTKALQGNNPLKVNVFPNPSKHDLTLSVLAPYAGDIDLLITNAEGKLLVKLEFDGIPAGLSTIELGDKLKLPNGLYNINIVFDGKFSAIEKIVITN